ncbi:hypothetical protein D3C76_998100 [compost metagenome]
MLCWSPIVTLSFSIVIMASLSAGTDSPVKAASSIFKLALSISLKSAGMNLPASITTISPSTTSSDGTSFSSPPLLTIALGVESSFNASKAFSALDS